MTDEPELDDAAVEEMARAMASANGLEANYKVFAIEARAAVRVMNRRIAEAVARNKSKAQWIRCKILYADDDEPGNVFVSIEDGLYDGTIISVHRDLVRGDLAVVSARKEPSDA